MKLKRCNVLNIINGFYLIFDCYSPTTASARFEITVCAFMAHAVGEFGFMANVAHGTRVHVLRPFRLLAHLLDCLSIRVELHLHLPGSIQYLL